MKAGDFVHIWSSASVAVGILALPAPALAQVQTAVSMATETPDDASRRNHVVIGIGAAAVPVLQGSKDYRVLPVPAIDVQQGWLFANLRNGIGVVPIEMQHLTIGAGAVYLQGYRRRDVPIGVDRLSDGVGVRLFGAIRSGGFLGNLGVTKGLAGQTKGVLVDASVSYPVPITPRLSLTPTLGTTWANAKYNDRYFGINDREALASGLARFSAGAGFKDVSETLTASYRLTDRIGLSVTGGATTLLGDAADSPLVRRRTTPTGLLSLSYSLR
ncbi:MipA/OmpV family protein [Sphingomonadaceae bacterium OTU29LAMAA1]|nr:MipA/OmpV family protein [Sphingomonadaceae bacterium OTU29LAMAA1]